VPARTRPGAIRWRKTSCPPCPESGISRRMPTELQRLLIARLRVRIPSLLPKERQRSSTDRAGVVLSDPCCRDILLEEERER